MKLSSGVVITAIPSYAYLEESKKDFWRKWIAALRSGEYRQVSGMLHGFGGYCCLGVASDLAIKDGVGSWEPLPKELDVFSHSVPGSETKNRDVLHDRTQALLGIYSGTALWVLIDQKTLAPDMGLIKGPSVDLTVLNDSCRATFEEIAITLEMAINGGFHSETVVVMSKTMLSMPT